MTSQILPTKEEIIPKELFSSGYFNRGFGGLKDHSKLRVINDIVRTSMVFDTCPNPFNHTEELRGDCLTACVVFINFAREIGFKHKLDIAIVRRRTHDPIDRTSTKHFVLLAEIEGEIFVIDPTPTKGYGLGTVAKLKDSSVAMSDLVVSNKHDLIVVDQIKELRWHLLNNLNEKKIFELERDILNHADTLKNREYLNAWFAEAYFSLGQYYKSKNTNLTVEYFQKAILLDPYKLKMLSDKEYLSKKLYGMLADSSRKFNSAVNIKINDWGLELHKLHITNTGRARINELNSFIALEKAMATGETIGVKINLNNVEYRVSDLTPRVFADNNLEAIVVRNVDHQKIKDSIKSIYSYVLDMNDNEISDWLPKITKDRLANMDARASIMLVEKTASLDKIGENVLTKASSYSESLILFMSKFKILSIINKWGYANPRYC